MTCMNEHSIINRLYLPHYIKQMPVMSLTITNNYITSVEYLVEILISYTKYECRIYYSTSDTLTENL